MLSKKSEIPRTHTHTKRTGLSWLLYQNTFAHICVSHTCGPLKPHSKVFVALSPALSVLALLRQPNLRTERGDVPPKVQDLWTPGLTATIVFGRLNQNTF